MSGALVTATLPHPAVGGPATDKPWYLDLLGCTNHEALMVVAALIDITPGVAHTYSGLHQQLRTRTRGMAGWYPLLTELAQYCAGLEWARMLTPARVAGRGRGVTVTGYRAVPVGRQRRCALYHTVIEWSLRYQGVSLRSLAGRPRLDAAGRLPVHLRLPLLRALLATREGLPYRRLTEGAAERGIDAKRVRQTIGRLCEAGVLSTTCGPGPRLAGAAITPAWWQPASELIQRLDAVATLPETSTGHHDALVALLEDQGVVADMLAKAAVHRESRRIVTVENLP